MNTVLSLVMLTAIALLGASYLAHKRGAPRKQVVLMVVLALVAVANVAIWTVPDGEGRSPVEQVRTAR